MEEFKAVDILESYLDWNKGKTDSFNSSLPELNNSINTILKAYKLQKLSENEPLTRSEHIEKVIELQIIRTFGYNFEDLNNNSRKPDFVKPRHISMYLLSKYTKLEPHRISYIFGQHKDMVYFSNKSIKELLKKESADRNVILIIEGNINEAI